MDILPFTSIFEKASTVTLDVLLANALEVGMRIVFPQHQPACGESVLLCGRSDRCIGIPV